MIPQLEVTNFQAHKHSLLEFSPGVNIIKGTSGSGKSSLIRAFDWIFNNRPINNDMRPWTDPNAETIASISLDDENYVSRIKNKKFNGYNSSVGDPEALGRDVPEEISTLINMNENLHCQDDGYFLLNDTPGNVARVLNRKSGLEDIDIVQKAAKGLISELQNDLKRKQADKKELKEELEKLTKLSKLKPKFDEISNLINKFNSLKETKEGLIDELNNIKLVTAAIEECENIVSKEKAVNEIDNLIHEVKDIDNWKTVLWELVTGIEHGNELIKELNYFVSFEKQIDNISALFQQLNDIRKNRDILMDILGDIRLTESRIQLNKDKLKLLEPRKKELEAQLDYCPTCGANKKHWRKILEK